ncbi:MAG: DUF86 domain-containing protein [Comamonadaceae bacterium]|nr:DUF86 domain-containing protein [Comamonadaceae bacterium]
MSKRARRLPERIQDIREAIGNARSDLGVMTKDQFLADGKTQRAVIESVIVIGESANSIMRLDSTIEHSSPETWQNLKDVYEMRIVLTHEYFRVDAAVVWDTLQNDLPKLEALINSLSDRISAEHAEFMSSHPLK